jgi:hypothetical protein
VAAPGLESRPGDATRVPTRLQLGGLFQLGRQILGLELAAAPWEGRHRAGYVVHNYRMWVVGGDVNQGRYQSDIWSSADGIQWEAPRTLHHTVTLNGWIYVLGGQTLPKMVSKYHSYSFALPDGEQVFYADCWRSSDGRNWQKVADDLPWSPRCMIGGSAVIVLDGRMWIIGGGTYDTVYTPSRIYHSDVWSSHDGISWVQHTKSAPWEGKHCILIPTRGWAE